MIVRNLEPRDLPRAWRMHDAQNRRDGTNYPFPVVFEMDESKPGFGQLVENVPLALVTERDGRVCQVEICMRSIELITFGGGDPEFTYAHIPIACDFLKRRGYDDVHAFVPKIRADERHSKLLEKYGLTRLDNRLAHFFRTT